MKTVPIVKYTSFGNNFVILDETQSPVLTELEKTRFAHQATNINFGVGSDNFLVIQSCRSDILEEINNFGKYWAEPPDPLCADYIFRMFESDGTEAYSCGNGLMSIADYLFRQNGAESVRIITEIPTPDPKVVAIGTDRDQKTNWANMVNPRRMPDEMVDSSIRTPISDEIDLIDNIPITNFREADSKRFFNNETSLTVRGHLVFTGEPHLVIFVDSGFSIEDLSTQIFLSFPQKTLGNQEAEKRASSSSAFVDFIGNYFAREFSDLFPVGININFVRKVENSKILEYRCFERGINHETLACGTGALAVAFVAKELNMVDSPKVVVWPHRCRWEIPDAEMKVEKCDRGWLLNGNPRMLLQGQFMWE